jgi:NADH dehydrogenase
MSVAPTRVLILGGGFAGVSVARELGEGLAPATRSQRHAGHTGHGRVVVNEYLEVPGRPGLWALGDCALVPDGRGGFHPPTAQHALRQGRVLAANLVASFTGEVGRPFRFSTLGQLAAIGRRTGVANVLGINFSGFVAWWLWRTVYLAKLPRFEKKVRVALAWALDWLAS